MGDSEAIFFTRTQIYQRCNPSPELYILTRVVYANPANLRCSVVSCFDFNQRGFFFSSFFWTNDSNFSLTLFFFCILLIHKVICKLFFTVNVFPWFCFSGSVSTYFDGGILMGCFLWSRKTKPHSVWRSGARWRLLGRLNVPVSFLYSGVRSPGVASLCEIPQLKLWACQSRVARDVV